MKILRKDVELCKLMNSTITCALLVALYWWQLLRSRDAFARDGHDMNPSSKQQIMRNSHDPRGAIATIYGGRIISHE